MNCAKFANHDPNFTDNRTTMNIQLKGTLCVVLKFQQSLQFPHYCVLQKRIAKCRKQKQLVILEYIQQFKQPRESPLGPGLGL